jgi:hypothetical protein
MPRWFLRWIVALIAAPTCGVALAQPAASTCESLQPAIAPRAADARDGSAFAALSEHDRDHAMRSEVLAGNVPGFLRRLQPVVAQTAAGLPRAVRVVFCALPDYLSIGSDRDFMSAPMSLPSALEIGARFGFMLPTRRMVDLIYQQASVQLEPRPLPAGERMRSLGYFRRHDALVREQRLAAGARPGVLTAGHKKDVVLSVRSWQQPDRVPIYGWHRAGGAPIQPLSTVHGARYVDYSHGVRLVSDIVFVNGERRTLAEVLADPALAPLLSDEGPLPTTRASTDAVARSSLAE